MRSSVEENGCFMHKGGSVPIIVLQRMTAEEHPDGGITLQIWTYGALN